MQLRTSVTLAGAIAGLLSLAIATPALAGKTIDAIKARGQLVCGVNTGPAGFSAADSQANLSGLDVDFCNAWDLPQLARRADPAFFGAYRNHLPVDSEAPYPAELLGDRDAV